MRISLTNWTSRGTRNFSQRRNETNMTERKRERRRGKTARSRMLGSTRQRRLKRDTRKGLSARARQRQGEDGKRTGETAEVARVPDYARRCKRGPATVRALGGAQRLTRVLLSRVPFDRVHDCRRRSRRRRSTRASRRVSGAAARPMTTSACRALQLTVIRALIAAAAHAPRKRRERKPARGDHLALTD